MADVSGAATEQFYRMLAESRTRVLTEHADKAEQSARHIRERMPRFPDHTAELDADAKACDEYAAACRAAAADHTLPVPSGPNYPPKVSIYA